MPTPRPQQSVRDPPPKIQGHKLGGVGREYRYRGGNTGTEDKREVTTIRIRVAFGRWGTRLGLAAT